MTTTYVYVVHYFMSKEGSGQIFCSAGSLKECNILMYEPLDGKRASKAYSKGAF